MQHLECQSSAVLHHPVLYTASFEGFSLCNLGGANPVGVAYSFNIGLVEKPALAGYAGPVGCRRENCKSQGILVYAEFVVYLKVLCRGFFLYNQ